MRLDEIRRAYAHEVEWVVDGGEYDYDCTTIVAPCDVDLGSFDHLFEFGMMEQKTVDFILTTHNDYVPWLIGVVDRFIELARHAEGDAGHYARSLERAEQVP